MIGTKLYKAATELLANTFDYSPECLCNFLNEVLQHNKSFGWVNILKVPPNLNEPNHMINLTQEYGHHSLKQVMAHAATYVNGQSRAAQDSYQLGECLMKSLSFEAKNKIAFFQNEYTIEETDTGTPFLKVFIHELHIDMNAIASNIHNHLSNLGKYMVDIDSDITKFNEYVKGLIDALHAHGKITHNLLLNLFKGYKAASNQKFITYISKKEDDYNENINIEPQHLMYLMDTKYKIRFDNGEWNAPTEDEEKIIALEARVEKLSISKANKTMGKTTQTA